MALWIPEEKPYVDSRSENSRCQEDSGSSLYLQDPLTRSDRAEH